MCVNVSSHHFTSLHTIIIYVHVSTCSGEWGRFAPVTAAVANPTHHREDQNETNIFTPSPPRIG